MKMNIKKIGAAGTTLAACVFAITVYAAAPPPAPADLHPEFEKIASPKGCLECHGKGGVKETPHPDRKGCEKCHAPKVDKKAAEKKDASKAAAPKASGKLPANKVHIAAPPMAPAKKHPGFDKIPTPDGCLKCHGPKGVIKSSHPERHNCKQCHIPFITDEDAKK